MDDDMVVAALDALGESDRTSVRGLLARAQTADAHPPLPDPQRHAVTTAPVTQPDGSDNLHGHVVLAHRGGVLVGAAVLTAARDHSAVLHVVLDPTVREGPDGAEGLTSMLLRRALTMATPGAAVHLWVMQAGPSDDARAAVLGFTTERDIVQMRVPLPLAAEVVSAARHLDIRAFVPGRDESAWVETNNRAFPTHPEQGGWTVPLLRERLAADWVDLDGFLVADDPDGPGLIGSCWTKVHADTVPVLGEIYIVAVDPRHHGQGWGRSLTIAGLEYLAGRGVRHAMLYTEADNGAALGLYRSLGFTIDHVDRSYRLSTPRKTETRQPTSADPRAHGATHPEGDSGGHRGHGELP